MTLLVLRKKYFHRGNTLVLKFISNFKEISEIIVQPDFIYPEFFAVTFVYKKMNVGLRRYTKCFLI